MRFDRAQHISNGLDGDTYPFYGLMENNVVYNTSGVMVKGNNNTIKKNIDTTLKFVP